MIVVDNFSENVLPPSKQVDFMAKNLGMSIELDDLLAAGSRISDFIVRTPVLSFSNIDSDFEASISFKCENMQHVGAFKSRGAMNAVLSLRNGEAQAGVVTHSSGNHGAALARAAVIRGIRAHIVMPENTRPNKIAAVRSYGVDPIFSAPTAEARQAAADDVIRSESATLIHPYDDPRIIAGQGTATVEFLEQRPNLDYLLVPVGGGGLLSGALIAAKSMNPEIKVIATEPKWADDAYRSLQTGERQMPTRYDTVADGLRTPLGELNFPIIQKLVDDIWLADETDIIDTTKEILTKAKIVVEPSAAVPFACLREHAEETTGKKVGILLSGGNLDLDHLPW